MHGGDLCPSQLQSQFSFGDLRDIKEGRKGELDHKGKFDGKLNVYV